MEQDDLPYEITECRDLHRLNSSDVCQFVNTTEVCQMTDGFLDYLYFAYCVFTFKLLPLATSLLVLWLVFLFIAIAVCADDFFCPVLVVISKTLRMSDNLAGVTLLAFGNGASDVFSAIAAVRSAKHGDVSLAFCALMGAGIFVTTVIAGSVCIVQPFRIMERPFLRDVIFYTGSVFFTFCILQDGKITTPEAIAYILLYVFYVLVVIVARFVYQKTKSASTTSEAKGLQGLVGSLVTNSVDEDYGDENTLDQPIYVPHHDGHDSNPANNQIQINQQNDVSESTPLIKNSNMDDMESSSRMMNFLCAISPVDTVQWKQASCIAKCIAVIKGLAKLILRITVPVVDYTEPKNNWNRFLNSMHCIISPVAALYLAKSDLFLYQIQGVFPVWAVVLILGFTVSLVVFFTSDDPEPPCYHWLFAYAGFITAIIWIQFIATEIVNLLQTFGIIFNLSNGILGITLLAWGNSISDLIADVTMAKHGYPRTAISACYGGPMFNLLLGVGISFTYACLKSGGHVDIAMSLVELLLVSCLLTILVVTMVTVPFVLKFQMTRVFGGALYAVYAIFIILVILVQLNVITFKI